jgi:hypothetical protein
VTKSLKNISLKLFREYLLWKGLKKIRTAGGHEIWAGKQLNRPVVLQSHIDPIPEFIVRNALRTLGASRDDFINFLKGES